MEVKVGVILDEPLLQTDPASIKNLSQAFIVRNLYAPLLDYDENAQIVSGLVDEFFWNENQLVFKFGKKSITQSGHIVGPKDAEASLKRLIVLGQNTHGNIGNFLCGNSKLKNINSDCEGIYSNENTLVLTVKSASDKEQLMTLLSSVDYRIIPLTALDLETLSITNMLETSGPYYVYSSFENDYSLKVNVKNYLYSRDIPQKVKLIQIKGKNPIEEFINGNVEVLPSFIQLTQADIGKIEKSNIEFKIGKTFDINVAMWIFSEAAQLKYTAQERFEIASSLSELLGDYSLPFSRPTTEFFQSFGEGFLNDEQLNLIKSLREKKSGQHAFKVKPTIAVRGFLNNNSKVFFQSHKELEEVKVETHPLNIPSIHRPDVFFGMGDVAYKSTYSIMSYYIKHGTFGIFGIEAEKWLNSFSSENNLKIKIDMINKLHFESLKKCAIFPISVGPYITLSRNGWRTEMNRFFSITRLWTMYHE